MDVISGKPKRKKDREQTMELIKEAALGLFSEVGFDKATTKVIASRAGVAEALIIRYFGSKKGLLISLTQQYVEELNQQSFDYPPQETIEDEIEKYVTFALRVALESKKVFKVVIVHTLIDEDFSEELANSIPRSGIRPVVIERFEYFRTKGMISKDITTEKIVMDLTFQILSFFLLSKPMFHIPSQESEKLLVSCARTYARGLRSM